MRILEAKSGIVTRRRFVVGAAAAAGTAILAACSVDTGPTPTTAPTTAPTATSLASPTRAAGVSSAVTAASPTATRAAAVATATTGATATRTTGSATVGSATATRMTGSAVAGSATAGTAAAGTSVRVVHASPDAPPLDLYIDGKKVVSALAFGKASDYQAVTAGRHDFQLFAAGADATRDKPVIDGRGTSVPSDAHLSIIALDRLASIKGLLADDRTTPPASGKARVKFIHAAPDAPSVDIAVRGGPVLFANTDFGKAYPYQDVDAKTYDLEVRPAGKSDVILTVPGVALTAGTVYSIYAVGLVSGAPKLTVAVFVDNR